MKSVPKPGNLLERDVVKQVCDFLEMKGWTPIRLHTGTTRIKNAYIRHGKKGRLDWVMVHPEYPAFYCEMKRNKGGQLSDEQIESITLLERQGYEVAVPKSIEEFQFWFAGFIQRKWKE